MGIKLGKCVEWKDKEDASFPIIDLTMPQLRELFSESLMTAIKSDLTYGKLKEILGEKVMTGLNSDFTYRELAEKDQFEVMWLVLKLRIHHDPETRALVRAQGFDLRIMEMIECSPEGMVPILMLIPGTKAYSIIKSEEFRKKQRQYPHASLQDDLCDVCPHCRLISKKMFHPKSKHKIKHIVKKDLFMELWRCEDVNEQKVDLPCFYEEEVQHVASIG